MTIIKATASSVSIENTRNPVPPHKRASYIHIRQIQVKVPRDLGTWEERLEV